MAKPETRVPSPSRQGLKDEGTKSQVALAGLIAGLISRFVIAPLDVIKIRLQLQPRSFLDANNALAITNANVHTDNAYTISNASSGTSLDRNHPAPYRNAFATARHIFATEGPSAFWKGNIPAEALYVCYSATQFTTYRFVALSLQSVSPEHRRLLPSAAEPLVCGAAAGGLATTVTYPLDLLRTRFAAQGIDRVYTSLHRAVADIARDEGSRGFFRGLSPALVQIMPYMGLFFCIYEGLRPTFVSLHAPWGGGDALAGLVASVVAKTTVFPLDLVRKRIQVQGPTRLKYAHKGIPEYIGGTIHTLATIVRLEGFRGLYRGLGIGLLKSAPASVVTLFVYERALEALKSSDE